MRRSCWAGQDKTGQTRTDQRRLRSRGPNSITCVLVLSPQQERGGLPTRWASLDLDFKILIPELQDDGTDLPKVLRCGGSKLVEQLRVLARSWISRELLLKGFAQVFSQGCEKSSRVSSCQCQCTLAPCYWPGHCAGRQVASGDGLICAKPD